MSSHVCKKKLSEKVTLLKCISVLCRNVLHGDRAVGTVPPTLPQILTEISKPSITALLAHLGFQTFRRPWDGLIVEHATLRDVGG